MGIGSGILLIVAGAVLVWAVDVDLPYIDGDALGMILMLAGIAVLIVSVVWKANRPEAGVGTGIALVAAGAIIFWAVDIEVPYIDGPALGAILMVAGVIAIAATVGMTTYRRRQLQRYQQYQQQVQQQQQYGGHQGPPPGYPGQQPGQGQYPGQQYPTRQYPQDWR